MDRKLDARMARVRGRFGIPATEPDARPLQRDGASPERPATTLLEVTPSQARQLVEFVRTNPHVQDNRLYASRANVASFLVVDSNALVNAFAGEDGVVLPDEPPIAGPVVVVLGGMVRAVAVLGAGLALHARWPEAFPTLRRDASVRMVFEALGSHLAAHGGRLESADAAELVANLTQGRTPSTWDRLEDSPLRTYVASMLTFVLAHEAGHLCLGHTMGRRDSPDVSRNQEREADSFAASVIASSPFRDHLFLGSLFVPLLFAWIEHAGGQIEGSTHPLGAERFHNALRSNQAALHEVERQIGLGADRLKHLLPPN